MFFLLVAILLQVASPTLRQGNAVDHTDGSRCWYSAGRCSSQSLVPGIYAEKRISDRKHHCDYCCGFLGVMADYSICQAIAGSSATMFNVISRVEIIIAMILGWVFLHEPVDLRIWMAVAVVLSGIVLMRGDTLTINLEDWEAVLWALCTAGCFASIQVLSKSIIHEVDPQVLNVLRLSLAVLILLTLPGLAVEVSMLTLEGWTWLGMAAFFGPFLGRIAYTYSLRYFTIAKAMTAITFSPVLTLIFEFLIFGRMLSTFELIGGALVITGILIVFRQTGTSN